ncbi:MAG: hypothetical protein ACI9WU_005068, partial [Myxococcota bacterium]
MGVEIRQFDRVKETVEIRLDSRQIGWLVIGCSAIAAGVFAAGFVVGQGNAQAMPVDQQTALVAGPAVAAADLEPRGAAIELAPAVAPMHYTYDRVLTDKTPPTKLDDPVIEAKAQERAQRALADAEVPLADAEVLTEPAAALEEGELEPNPATDKPADEPGVAEDL